MLQHEGRLFSNILGLCGVWGVIVGNQSFWLLILGLVLFVKI
jgi:hypothetical protein